MALTLEDLKITTAELDNLIQLGVIDLLAIDLYKTFCYRDARRILSLIINNAATFILILIFLIPTCLIALRNTVNTTGNTTLIYQALTIILGISVLCLAVCNLYLWKQAKQLKSLAILTDKVEQYNRVIAAIALVDKLETAQTANNREELLETLQPIKASLLNAIRVENIIRKHKDLMTSRYELFANLETNFNALIAFEPTHQASEYRNLLEDALQIGLAVHKEVRNLKSRKSKVESRK